MRYLIIFIIITFSKNALVESEIWQCYDGDKNIENVYKLDTDVPSVAIFQNANWKHYSNRITYDKENQNIQIMKLKIIFDLLLKDVYHSINHSDNPLNCSVIDTYE